MNEPARILEARAASDRKLYRGLQELRALPTAGELRGAFARLEAELGDEARERDADSGVRPAPWAQLGAQAAGSQAADAARAADALPSVATAQVLAGRKPRRRRARAAALIASGAAALAFAAACALWLARAQPIAHAVASGALAVTAAQGSELAAEPKSPPRADAAAQSLAPTAGSTPSASPRAARRSPARAPRAEIASAELDSEPATGVLNINSIPFSRVVLDGRPLGDTPRVQVAVSPGVHTVLFVHPEYGRIFREVRVDAGRAALAAVRFPLQPNG